jgi:N-acetylglucosamine-6-phosphate deacetylase
LLAIAFTVVQEDLPMSGRCVALSNVEIISDGRRLKNQVLFVENGKIVNVVPLDNATTLLGTCSEVITLEGYVALPGLIDLQIYGAGSLLFGGNPTIEALDEMERELCRQGVTGFLATIATNTRDIITQGTATAHAVRGRGESVGNFWGLHLEGPYLNAAKRGAHPEHLIRTATLAEVKELTDEADGCIRMMTIAPEKVPSDVMEHFTKTGIVMSAGHSNATYDEGCNFLPNRVHTVTHLFNAMPSLHHRELGFTLAVLEKRPFASIVVDGIHVAYPMVRLAKQLLREKLFLITDAVTSCSSGIYPHILHNDDRYVMPDGTLSGSTLTLLKAIQNCVNHCDIPLEEAVNMATLYPAQVLGVAETKGSIAVGKDADLCIVTPDLQPLMTIIGGKAVFRAIP